MKFNESLITAALLAVGSLAAVSANAASPATGSFKVNLTVQASCNVTAAIGTQDINFGAVDAKAIVALTASSAATIDVECSKGTPFKVALSPTGTSTTGTGTLKSTTTGNSDTIPYSLYSNAGATTVWGNTVSTNTVNGTGTGFGGGASLFKYTATAKVLTTDVKPDTYSDTVAVAVTY